MLGAIFLVNGSSLGMEANHEEIKDFDLNQDGKEVEQMLANDCQELFANPEFNIWNMLFNRTITPQVKNSHNSLIMRILKSKYFINHPIKSFVAYEKSDSTVFIRLLVTHFEAKRNGHATHLLRHVINSLGNQGVTQLRIDTRKQNFGAVAFYEKLLGSLNNVSYTKNHIIIDNTDVISYKMTLSKKE